jgi:transcriptional regulator with XRE-family HTH domain
LPDDLSPTLRRWELGGALRQIREDQHKTIEQVAHDLSELHGGGFSAAKIGRLETGKRGANPRDVRDLCDYYKINPTERDRLVELAKEVRQDNRLQPIDVEYAEFIALESIARTVRTYEPMFVPGLLQTADFYRAVFDGYARAELGLERIADGPQAHIDIRRQRQSRLAGDNPLYLRAIIDENVIRRHAGSDDVMSKQLKHLIDMSHKPNITLRVIPASCGFYPGCESSGFTLLEYDQSEHLRENACYIEGFTTSLWAEQTAERLHVAGVFKYLESIALGTEESRALINEALRRY